MKNYAKAMKVIRAASGLSQEEVSNRIGCDPSYVSLIESGRRTPSVDILSKFSEALGMSRIVVAAIAGDQLMDEGPIEYSELVLRYLLDAENLAKT